MDWAVAVAGGGETLGEKCEQGSVLLAALEDNARRLQARLRTICPSACAESPFAERLTIWTEMPPLEDGGLDRLHKWLTDHTDARLVIIDVFSRVRSSPSRSEGDYLADYRALVPIKALADEFGIAVVVVHHTRKMGADDKLDIVSGTNGLAGAADTVLVLDRALAGETLYGRGRDIEEIDVALEFDSDTCRWEVVGPTFEAHLGETKTKVLAALREIGQPASADVIAAQAGLKVGHVRVVLGRLRKDGRVSSPMRGLYVVVEARC
jgi:RecA-family ATPase